MNVYKVSNEAGSAVVVSADDRTGAQQAAERLLGDGESLIVELVLAEAVLAAGVGAHIASHVAV